MEKMKAELEAATSETGKLREKLSEAEAEAAVSDLCFNTVPNHVAIVDLTNITIADRTGIVPQMPE